MALALYAASSLPPHRARDDGQFTLRLCPHVWKPSRRKWNDIIDRSKQQVTVVHDGTSNDDGDDDAVMMVRNVALVRAQSHYVCDQDEDHYE